MPQVVLTFDQLEAMPKPQFGGKFACERQRELRAELLQSGTYEHDLTHEAWPWRDVIRSLPQHLRWTLVGPGVTLFTFKLVRCQIDHNYYDKFPNDSGERHVFHIQRTDNVAHHLHYHPNGTLDDPVKSQHNITVQNTLPGGPIIRQEHFTTHDWLPLINGALQPVDFDGRFITGPTVGRKEAASACTILLDACGGQRRAASVDVTDELAFPWRRWLLHQTNSNDAMPHNIVRVFICRGLFVFDETMIACCRADGTYACFYPGRKARKLEIFNDWPAMTLFQNPYYVNVPWNRMPVRA